MTWEAGPLKQRITELGLDAAVSRLGYVPHHDLPAIYGGPLFCFPVPVGRVRIPVLEAMACGAPVLTSNISSLPELAGDAAILVDSTSTQGIADGMARLGEDTALRARLSAAGRTRARFSWSRTAAETRLSIVAC